MHARSIVFAILLLAAVNGIKSQKNVKQTNSKVIPERLVPADLREDIKNKFDVNLLNDKSIINELSKEGGKNSAIMDVLTGNSTLDDISDDDFKNVPVKLLQGFKRDEIKGLSADKVAATLDSDVAAQDPTSLSKMLSKLDLSQFKDALKILSDKMNQTKGAPWRPPISIQKVVANAFSSYRHGDGEDILNSFLKHMCPFTAGVDFRQIVKLPRLEPYVARILACFDRSYKDLDASQRQGVVRWVRSMWKLVDISGEKLDGLRNFILDFPLEDIRTILEVREVVRYVQEDLIHGLDSNHEAFHSFAGFIARTLVEDVGRIFQDPSIARSLGKVTCFLRVDKLQDLVDSSVIRLYLDYIKKNCKDREDELEDSLSECSGEASSRLQRCQILKKELEKLQRKSSSSSSTSKVAQAFERPGVMEYKNMKLVVNTYLEDKDKSEYNSSDIRSVAEAFSVFKPKEIDQIPDEAILDNLDVLKNNSNLSSKQKRKLFKKMENAGLEVSPESLVNLGEFVTSVRPKQFRQLEAIDIEDSLGELSKHAKDFSRAQKKAIIETLSGGNVTNILQQDLGDLAGEIPLADLKNVDIRKGNLESIGKQKWDRGQAANLFRQYKESGGMSNSTMSVSDIREMGHTSVGLACKDIKEIIDEEAYEAAQALVEETESSLTLDMIGCIAKKLHKSLQNLHGADYMSNETDSDLATTLEYIPEDIAMMMPLEQLEMVPMNACMALMGNIGRANLDKIPLSKRGIHRRRVLANITLHCIEGNRSPDLNQTVSPPEALTFGQLMCDLNVEQWEKFELDSFIEMLPEISSCFYRLPEQNLRHITSRITDKYGNDTSAWTPDVVETVGRMIALFDAEHIDSLTEETVFEVLDSIAPPQLDDDASAYPFMNYDTLYKKFRDSVQSYGEVSQGARIIGAKPVRRKKRDVTAPTYDDIVLLGAGNVAWSVEELDAISAEDFANALPILGAIKKWSSEQQSTLVEKIKTGYGSADSWNTTVIGDAQHLLKGLNNTELDGLVIDDIEIFAQLSDVNFTNSEKYMLVEAYLEGASTNLSTLLSSDLAGFESLACGINEAELADIPDAVIQAALKDLGELDCFSQDQYDYLKAVAVSGRDSPIPTDPELYEMGSIAAGLTVDDLKNLSAASIEFIQPIAFSNMMPSRIRDGLTSSQLLAAGTGNIEVFFTPRVFDELTLTQQTALEENAVRETTTMEPPTTTHSPTEPPAATDAETPKEDAVTTTTPTEVETPKEDEVVPTADAITDAPKEDAEKTTMTNEADPPKDNEVTKNVEVTAAVKTDSPKDDDVTAPTSNVEIDSTEDNKVQTTADNDIVDDADPGDNSVDDDVKDEEETTVTTTTASSAAVLPSIFSISILLSVSALLM